MTVGATVGFERALSRYSGELGWSFRPSAGGSFRRDEARGVGAEQCRRVVLSNHTPLPFTERCAHLHPKARHPVRRVGQPYRLLRADQSGLADQRADALRLRAQRDSPGLNPRCIHRIGGPSPECSLPVASESGKTRMSQGGVSSMWRRY